MSLELTGTIKVIGETQTFGNNGFRKRELVIETNEQYPQPILIDFVQDKCDVLNSYKVGQVVKVGINLRGRSWQNPQGETKYFNSINGWRIAIEGSAVDQYQKQADEFEPESDKFEPESDKDELPF